MPYIKTADRERLAQDNTPQTPGELNYLITLLALKYVNYHGEGYTTHNEIVGVLECAKQEWYRVLVSKMEDNRKWQNGDVYNGK